MSILVLAEGITDRGAIKAVARRLHIPVRVALMHGNRLERIRGLVRVYATTYYKFIVLKDLHRYSEDTIRRWYGEIRRDVDGDLKDRIRFVLVRQSIEAWFLADTLAVSRVFKCRIEIDIENPELVKDPVEELDKLLRREGKTYYKAEGIAEKIMEESDLKRISEKAGSFREFLNHLTDP